MKFKTIFLILIISVFFISIPPELSFSQQAFSCPPHTVCVHTGDMLKYSINLDVTNSTQIYKFSEMVDSIHMRIIEQNLVNDSIHSNNLTLSIKTGFVQNEQDANIVKPFILILSIPIDYDTSDISITPIVSDFNGFKRTALDVFHSTENSTSEIEYDVETGILLNVHTTSIIKINDKSKVVTFSNKLTRTNMIYSNSENLPALKTVVPIPNWIRTASSWWTHDKIPDSEFVKVMQYMISNGMMQVHHDSSKVVHSQPIPMWMKNDADWWMNGQISDDEFVKEMQWLIDDGLIKV